MIVIIVPEKFLLMSTPASHSGETLFFDFETTASYPPHVTVVGTHSEEPHVASHATCGIETCRSLQRQRENDDGEVRLMGGVGTGLPTTVWKETQIFVS